MSEQLAEQLGVLSLEDGGNVGLPSCEAEANTCCGAADFIADDMTCAVCLGQIDPVNLASVKGCGHTYCVHCILQWATFKEWCPQCKTPFVYLITHRQLDGTVLDYPVEESVCLLKRARWFEDHVKALEKGKAAVPEAPAAGSASGGSYNWFDFYEDYEDVGTNEDDEIEDFYFSNAAGRSRIVIGNRRGGENGYMRSGRIFARVATNNLNSSAQSPAAQTSAAKGKGKAKPAKGGASSPVGAATAASSSRSSGFVASGSSPPGSEGKVGRRARRNAKRAMYDDEDGY